LARPTASTSFPSDIFSLTRELERMKWPMINFAPTIQVDDINISEELIGRLQRATEDSVLELVANFQANQRASLAVHCYRKSHLHQTGLTIASTCDLSSLVGECGPILGAAIFAQSRKRSEEPKRLWERVRPTVTLACSAGGSYPPLVDLDEAPCCEQAVPA
jgi:hypothetical protein